MRPDLIARDEPWVPLRRRIGAPRTIFEPCMQAGELSASMSCSAYSPLKKAVYSAVLNRDVVSAVASRISLTQRLRSVLKQPLQALGFCPIKAPHPLTVTNSGVHNVRPSFRKPFGGSGSLRFAIAMPICVEVAAASSANRGWG